MGSMLPKARPLLSAEDARKLAKARCSDAIVLLGIRGYYRDSMGEPGKNDRSLYDDAMFLITPLGATSFNANTDPSVYRKNVAVLQPGVWLYETGFHGISRGNPYPALRQCGRVVVHRDGVGQDDGFFAINIHRGGVNSTSSLGCQTVPPSQWDVFIDSVYVSLGVEKGVAGARRKAKIKYVLMLREQAEQILGRPL